MAASLSRRAALSLLAGVPFAARLTAQSQTATRRVIPGYTHTLLVESDGSLWGWSSSISPNAAGEFGLGHTRSIARFSRTRLPIANVVAAGAGLDCSFAVLADGRLTAWGTDRSGILGITPRHEFEKQATPRSNVTTPTPVATAFDATDVAVGGRHVLALARDGSVYAWGEDAEGRLGVGPQTVIDFLTYGPSVAEYVPFPIRVAALARVVAVSAGFQHSLALLDDGTIRAWGRNAAGQLGDGTAINRTIPVRVAGIRTAVAIDAGDDFSSAVLANGAVMTWGANIRGSLGRAPLNGVGKTANPVPALVAGAIGVRGISAGTAHVLALTNAGTVSSWGSNTHGETGQGAHETGPLGLAPHAVGELTNVLSIVADRARSYAVLRDGTIMTWGTPVPEWQDTDGRILDHSARPIALSLQ